MGQISTIEDRLCVTPTSKALRRFIIDEIFHINWVGCHIRGAENFDCYFNDWYDDQCEAAVRQVSVNTHREVLAIIALLQDASASREDIFERIRLTDAISSKEHINGSIELAARLWLTISIGSLQQSLAPGDTISWQDEPLCKTIDQIICPEKVLGDQIRLPKIFNAANLERIASIKILWTSNLADHLCLTNDDTELRLYHQVSFLELHKNKYLQDSLCSPAVRLTGFRSILHEDFIQETIRTLALLIPSTDRASQAWFHQKQRSHGLDSRAGSYGPLDAASRQTQCFFHWRDRLIVLKQVFDDSEPHTIYSWWYDDRKKVQWYTFWVAAFVLILTIVFGMTQSIAGVVQAWAAVKSVPHQ